MTKRQKIKFVCNAVKWFDKVNGNTYHSVRVTRCSDGAVIAGVHPPYEQGYGEQTRYFDNTVKVLSQESC